MTNFPRVCRIALVALILVAISLANEEDVVAKRREGLRVLTHIPYNSGTDISFAGDRAFFTQSGSVGDGRVRILDSSSAKPKLVGDFVCGGNQNDVAAITENLIAVGSHTGSCGPQPSSGINIIDVTDPKAPKQLGFAVLPFGTHTLTVHPNEPLIYASNSINDPTFIIDISNPLAPITIPTKLQTCHDITFHITKQEQFAFCAGGSPNTQIWDVTEPLDPSVVSTITDRGIGYHHEAMVTPDGKYLVIGDEARGGSCSNNQESREPGALSIFDITDRKKPKMAGFMNAPRGPSVCWAHNFNFIDDRTLVIAWWQAGTSVIDIAKPATPQEVDFFQPNSKAAWSSYFYKGKIWINSESGAWVLGGFRTPPRSSTLGSRPETDRAGARIDDKKRTNTIRQRRTGRKSLELG